MSNTTGFRRQPRATVWLPPRPSSPSRSNGLLALGRWDEAAERFGVIIDHQQRRAARIASHYLRDPSEVDEVVRHACLRAFLHLLSFRDELFLERWLTRILVNACLDRLKAKKRRARWLVPYDHESWAIDGPPSNEPSPRGYRPNSAP